MKFEKNERMRTIALYTFLVLAAVVALVFLLIRIEPIYNFILTVLSVLSPVIGGVVVAYLLNPLLNFFERIVFKNVVKKKPYSKLRRGLSITCVMLCVVLVIYIIIMILLPQITESYNILSENYKDVDTVVSSITSAVKGNSFLSPYYDTVLRILGIDPESGDSAIIEKAYDLLNSVLPSIVNFVRGLANGVYNTVIAFVFAVYLLAYREKMRALFRKIARAIFSEKRFDSFMYVCRVTDDNFGSYLRHKLFDSAIVLLFSYLAYFVLGLKYFSILAIITGVSNFIPFFGPIIGSIPVAFIVLLTQPDKVIWTILIIIAVQQFDLRIVRPVLLHRKDEIPAVWVITSTLVFGALLGLVGMLIGVPLFATLYKLIGDKINSKLVAKSLPVPLEGYYPEVSEASIGPLFKKKDSKKKKKDKNESTDKEDKNENKDTSDLTES